MKKKKLQKKEKNKTKYNEINEKKIVKKKKRCIRKNDENRSLDTVINHR